MPGLECAGACCCAVNRVVLDEGIGVIILSEDNVYKLVSCCSIVNTGVREAFEEIVNLGDFWDSSVLEENKEAIKKLVLEKSRGYERAYLLLAAYGKLMEAEERIIAPLLNRSKLSASVKRLLHGLSSEAVFKKETALLRAIGMNGETEFKTFEHEANTVFHVTDKFHTAFFILNEVVKAAERQGLSLKVSYDPITPWRVDAVLLSDLKIAFVCGDGNDRRINSMRFFDKEGYREARERLKKLEGEAQNIRELTLSTFEEIKEYHFTIEEIYSSAMDFSQKEGFVKKFIKKLFK